MKAHFYAAIAAVLVFASGCATISAGPAIGPSDAFVKDMRAAKFNADEAVRIGIFDANNPAPYCFGDILNRIDGPDPASFEPKVDGIVSAAMVAYIEAEKLKKLRAQGLQVDPACEALVGRVVIGAMKATGRAVTPSIMGLIK